MTLASRARGAAALVMGAALLAACTSGAEQARSPSASSSTTSPSAEPSTSTTPTPTPSPSPPPLTPGTSRGALIVVQQAEDASLVAGDRPIRLTLARTGNRATWFTSPPQRLTGTMTTEQALLTLGWRPADDGTTSVLPNPRPNGLLAYTGGALAFTVQRANVRADGTLVLDIRPLGATPETVESFGPVSLTLDGAPGVLDFAVPVGDLTVRITITGQRSQQAAVQVLSPDGAILESGFLAQQRPVIDTWLDVTGETTVWSDPVVTFTPPERSKAGTIRLTGIVTIDGVDSALDEIAARWSVPLG